MKNQRLIYALSGGALLMGLALLIYYGAFSGGFVSDDGFQILENPWIKDPTHLGGIFTHSLSGFTDYRFQKATYRPLMYVAFTIEYALFGLNATPWHVVNVLVHGANGVLVFLIFSRLLGVFGPLNAGQGGRGSWTAAVTAGALFVSHPAASEPVSWISALPELGFTFSVLLAFYLHTGAGARQGRGQATAVSQHMQAGQQAGPAGSRVPFFALGPVFFFFGLLFKETAVVLPVLVLVFDLFSGRAFRKKSLMLYAGYGAAFFLYMALRINALGGLLPSSNLNAQLGTGGLVLNAFYGFFKAMVLLFWPVRAYPFQIFSPLGSPLEPAALASFFIAAAFIVLLAVLFIKRANALVFVALAIMVLPLLPALYTPVITRFDFAPRYVYLSSAGFAMLVVFAIRWFFVRCVRLRRPGPEAAAFLVSWVLIVFCAFSSAARTRYWHDNMSLARAALRGSADNYYAHYQIGVAEQGRGNHEEATRHFRAAIELLETKFRQDRQTLRDALLRLAASELALGRDDEALTAYSRVLAFLPANATANYQTAYIYQGRGDCKRALYYYAAALRTFRRPADRKDTLLNMGNCFARLGQYEEAYGAYAAALEAVPGDPLVRRNMAALERMAARGRRGAETLKKP